MKKPNKSKQVIRPDELIYVNNHIFLGRVEEQKQFRQVLAEVLNPPKGEEDEIWPYVLLLHGDGGMGKTTLARRFRDIAGREVPFEGQFQLIWVDWEIERGRSVALDVGRERIAPEAVLESLHSAVIRDNRDRFARHFDDYQKIIKLRVEAEKQAAQALAVSGERDALGELRGLGADALAKLARQSLPVIGETGEKATKALSQFGLKLAEDQARNLLGALNTRLRDRLKPEQFDIFLNPQERLARALGEGFKRLTEDGLIKLGRPLIVVLDTYEIVDRADVWLRVVMRAAGPRTLWIVCGRDDLSRSRQFGDEYFTGYSQEWPRRFRDYNMPQLALDDVRRYFAEEAAAHPLTDAEAEAVNRATRGIPLAIREAAEMRQRGVAIADIVSDIDEATPSREIVKRMTERYLLHARNEDDRRALYALALAAGDRERLRAMLRPADDQSTGATFDLDKRLGQLRRDYASVHFDESRLQDEPALFFREHLKTIRDEDWVKEFNRRAADVLGQKLNKMEAQLPHLEDRSEDEDWTAAALNLADHLFWLDEDDAWRWFVPRFAESLAYGNDLRDGLVKLAESWKAQLSRGGQKRAKLLSNGADWNSKAEDKAALLDDLERLAKLGWLRDSRDGELENQRETERRAILDWQRGQAFYQRERYTEALSCYERAERGLPPMEEGDAGALRKRLASSMNSLAAKFIWPAGQSLSCYSPEAERILPKVVEWLPEDKNAWYNLAVTLGDSGKLNEASIAFQQAVALDPKYTSPHTGLGKVYLDLQQYDQAIAEYQQAIALNPKSAYAHYGLGNVYRALGKNEEAIAAYQQAIALDPKYAYPHNGLGNVYRNLQQYEQAVAAYQQAIALDPKYASPHNGLGIVYRDLGKNEEAIAAFQQAIALDPKSAYTHHGLGNVYSDLGKTEEAIAAYQQAIALDPKYAYPHHGLGNVYQLQGEREKALAAHRKAVELDPKKGSFRSSLVGILRKLGCEAEAAEQIQIARELIVKEDDYNRACFEAICGNADEALLLLRTALEKRQASVDWASRDPDFDSLRDDPRFAALLEETKARFGADREETNQ